MINKVTVENNKHYAVCAVCAGAAGYLMFKEEYPLYRCVTCGLVFVDPQPSKEYLKEEVYSAKSGYQGNKSRNLEDLKPTSKQVKVLDFLSKVYFVSAGSSSRTLLDIGCSNGEFMFYARSLGFRVYGIEPNRKTADIARANGLDVRDGFLDKTGLDEENFDVIHLGDVIEHVNDPSTLIKECKSLLAPGGELIVVTPNLDCFWARSTYMLYRLFGIAWSVCTPPHHLFQFSENNIKRLLESDGLTIEEVWFDRLSSLKYELGSLHLIRRWKRQKNLGNAWLVLFGFSLYSALFCLNRVVECFPVKKFGMTIIARKP